MLLSKSFLILIHLVNTLNTFSLEPSNVLDTLMKSCLLVRNARSWHSLSAAQRFVSIYTHVCRTFRLFWPQNCNWTFLQVAAPFSQASFTGKSSLQFSSLEIAYSGCPTLATYSHSRGESRCWRAQHVLIKQCTNIFNVIVWELCLLFCGIWPSDCEVTVFPSFHLPTTKLEKLPAPQLWGRSSLFPSDVILNKFIPRKY